jgi:hypothetical protein
MISAKHSSLFDRSASDEEKNNLTTLTPGVNVLKLFSFVTDDEA